MSYQSCAAFARGSQSWGTVVLFRKRYPPAEDCKVLSDVLGDTATTAGSAAIDIPSALEIYNQRRHKDVSAVTEISEEGMGGGRSMRPAFMAQLVIFSFLHKTLGRLFPKVSSHCR